MAFGQIIKNLRTESGRTQEQLAELLNISPQAVSRWENNAAMPDISLLPPLANLFQVTIDHLLEMDTYCRDLRRDEYNEAYENYWNKEDKEGNYQIALKAAAEYPGDMEYLKWLADSEFYVAFLREDEEAYHELLERCVQHARTVLENASGEKLNRAARHTIVLALHWLGRKEEAKAYAMHAEEERERDDLLVWCLEGEELDKHNQKLLNRKLFDLLMQLNQLARRQKSLEAYGTVEEILKLFFPREDYFNYHNTLQYNFLQKACILCDRKKYEEAVQALQKARHHAEEMTKFGRETFYRHTSPLFDLLEGEKPFSDAKTTDVEDFVDYLQKHHCFDPIREREDFRALENL